MPNITCAGPGPHVPASGILGTSSVAPTADVRCASPACVKPVDPSAVVQTSLQTKAAAALAVNSTFLAIASPTNAQIVAQVRTATRELNALIRLTQGLLDTDDA